jgi:hypothetical protein
MRRLLIVGLLVGLAGCATPRGRWVHPTKGPEQLQADAYDCEKVAEQSSKAQVGYYNVLIAAQEENRCLRLKHGWRYVRE